MVAWATDTVTSVFGFLVTCTSPQFYRDQIKKRIEKDDEGPKLAIATTLTDCFGFITIFGLFWPLFLVSFVSAANFSRTDGSPLDRILGNPGWSVCVTVGGFVTFFTNNFIKFMYSFPTKGVGWPKGVDDKGEEKALIKFSPPGPIGQGRALRLAGIWVFVVAMNFSTMPGGGETPILPYFSLYTNTVPTTPNFSVFVPRIQLNDLVISVPYFGLFSAEVVIAFLRLRYDI